MPGKSSWKRLEVGLLFKICELLTGHGVDICTVPTQSEKTQDYMTTHASALCCLCKGSAIINTSDNGIASILHVLDVVDVF